MIYISGTYFDSSILVDDKRIELDRYNLIRANHPNNKKMGDTCIYYKESLGIILHSHLRKLLRICQLCGFI